MCIAAARSHCLEEHFECAQVSRPWLQHELLGVLLCCRVSDVLLCIRLPEPELNDQSVKREDFEGENPPRFSVIWVA